MKMFGLKARKIIKFDVAEAIGAFDALDPALGTRLAMKIIVESQEGRAVVLDFSHVMSISTSFMNAMFLALANSKSLDQWRKDLDFSGLNDQQRSVVTRCLQAVRNSLRVSEGNS
jgi:hypothetical protein